MDPPPIAPRWPRTAFASRLIPTYPTTSEAPPRALKPLSFIHHTIPGSHSRIILHTILRILAISTSRPVPPLSLRFPSREQNNLAYLPIFFFFWKGRKTLDVAVLPHQDQGPDSPGRPQSPKTRECGEWSGIGADIGPGIGPKNEGDRKSSISLTIPLHGQYPGVRSIRAIASARHPDIALDGPPFAIPA